MASGRVVYSNPNNMSVMLQSEGLSSSSSSSPVLESLWVNSSDPTFHGSSSMYCFRGGRQTAAMDAPFFQQQLIKEESCGGSGGGDDYDDLLHQPEKKRRLTAEQVQSLERSFEGEHKLEPERKVQLAKELGLQPRQVAIWFQNRRARSKTKQLERDYGSLKARFDTLKADHENLLKEKEHLASEVLLLTDKLQVRERESGHSSEPQKPISSPHGEPAENPIPHGNSVTVFNHQDAIGCSLLEPTDSSYGIEQEHSDFSQDEEDQSRFPLSPSFPRLEFVDYNSCHDTVPPPNSCNFGFTVDDQPFCFWPY